MLKTLFLIYPTDSSECLDFCPNIKWLRNFFSGRPTPAGLIMDGWRPMGMYLVIPNSSMELMRKKNRPLVETIISRMLRIQKLTGARTIGLAGQLGPIFTRKGDVKLTNKEEANQQLGAVDIVINLLPRGKDFMDCQLHRRMPATATIVDFSRPPIPTQAIPQKVVMGNRVQRSGMRFCMRLPGGWKRHELPACSMPSLLASLSRVPIKNIEEFRFAARQFQFHTALAGAPVQPLRTFGNSFRDFAAVRSIATRFSLFILRNRQPFSR
jgi:hypothetical protein